MGKQSVIFQKKSIISVFLIANRLKRTCLHINYTLNAVETGKEVGFPSLRTTGSFDSCLLKWVQWNFDWQGITWVKAEIAWIEILIMYTAISSSLWRFSNSLRISDPTLLLFLLFLSYFALAEGQGKQYAAKSKAHFSLWPY